MIKYFAPLIFLLFLVSGFITRCKYIEKDRQVKSLSQSLEHASNNLEYFKTQSKMLAARNDALVLSCRELSLAYPDIIKEIRDLKIKPQRVDHYAETVICQEKEIVQTLRDSIVRDTIKAKVFDYHDDFYDVHGIAISDTQHVSIRSRDTIVQVVFYGERRHKWLWVFSRRKLQQVIASKNPNSTIVYSQDIEISR
jgi:hypothetical protein